MDAVLNVRERISSAVVFNLVVGGDKSMHFNLNTVTANLAIRLETGDALDSFSPFPGMIWA